MYMYVIIYLRAVLGLNFWVRKPARPTFSTALIDPFLRCSSVFTMISTQTQFQVYRLLACLRTGDTQGTTTWRTHHVSRVVADRLHAQLLGVAVRFLALCRHQSTRVGQNAGCMQAMRVACVPSPVPETVMWYSSTIPCTSGAIVAHLQVMCAEAAHCRRNIGTLASPRQSV